MVMVGAHNARREKSSNREEQSALHAGKVRYIRMKTAQYALQDYLTINTKTKQIIFKAIAKSAEGTVSNIEKHNCVENTVALAATRYDDEKCTQNKKDLGTSEILIRDRKSINYQDFSDKSIFYFEETPKNRICDTPAPGWCEECGKAIYKVAGELDCPEGSAHKEFCAKQCSPGEYLDTEVFECMACPAGQYTAQTNRDFECTECREGQSQTQRKQHASAATRASTMMGGVQGVPRGKYSDKQNVDTACSECGAEEKVKAGATGCIACEAGFYYNEVQGLPGGQYTLDKQNVDTACSECGEGKMPNNAKTGCVASQLRAINGVVGVRLEVAEQASDGDGLEPLWITLSVLGGVSMGVGVVVVRSWKKEGWQKLEF